MFTIVKLFKRKLSTTVTSFICAQWQSNYSFFFCVFSFFSVLLLSSFPLPFSPCSSPCTLVLTLPGWEYSVVVQIIIRNHQYPEKQNSRTDSLVIFLSCPGFVGPIPLALVGWIERCILSKIGPLFHNCRMVRWVAYFFGWCYCFPFVLGTRLCFGFEKGRVRTDK